MSKVTPILVGKMILEPIRDFFRNGAPEPFRWDPDAKKSKIDISMVNDAHKEEVDHGMQILVDRGGFRIDKTGISDNLADQQSFHVSKGSMYRENLLLCRGDALVIVKARNEGNTEVLTDMVMHVLLWSRPHICDILGFKEFALPMTVSQPTPGKVDTEMFQVQISIPYILEERWFQQNEGLRIRDVLMTMK